MEKLPNEDHIDQMQNQIGQVENRRSEACKRVFDLEGEKAQRRIKLRFEDPEDLRGEILNKWVSQNQRRIVPVHEIKGHDLAEDDQGQKKNGREGEAHGWKV